MAIELTTLRFKTQKLGTAREVRELLSDFEHAYNSIHIFNVLADSSIEARDRRREAVINELNYLFKTMNSRASENIDYRGYDAIYSRLNQYINYILEVPPQSITSQISGLGLDDMILPEEKLTISKISIQSPGFYEFLGAINPLQQLREYLKDRHERNKDRAYRNDQERRERELTIAQKENDIIKQRVEIFKSVGYTEAEIRPVLTKLIFDPMQRLDKYQDKGLIGPPE